jgi:hypothetical protein
MEIHQNPLFSPTFGAISELHLEKISELYLEKISKLHLLKIFRTTFGQKFCIIEHSDAEIFSELAWNNFRI